jgi:hypothetical protein
MKTNSHAFCRQLLFTAREEAGRAKLKLPVDMTAMQSTRDSYFIEAWDRVIREYVKGCCSWSAKAHYIMQLIDKGEAGHGND